MVQETGKYNFIVVGATLKNILGTPGLLVSQSGDEDKHRVSSPISRGRRK